MHTPSCAYPCTSNVYHDPNVPPDLRASALSSAEAQAKLLACISEKPCFMEWLVLAHICWNLRFALNMFNSRPRALEKALKKKNKEKESEPAS